MAQVIRKNFSGRSFSSASVLDVCQTMEHYLVERGQAERAQRFGEAFRRLRQNQK